MLYKEKKNISSKVKTLEKIEFDVIDFKNFNMFLLLFILNNNPSR
jgi:hypothetical protein